MCYAEETRTDLQVNHAVYSEDYNHLDGLILQGQTGYVSGRDSYLRAVTFPAIGTGLDFKDYLYVRPEKGGILVSAERDMTVSVTGLVCYVVDDGTYELTNTTLNRAILDVVVYAPDGSSYSYSHNDIADYALSLGSTGTYYNLIVTIHDLPTSVSSVRIGIKYGNYRNCFPSLPTLFSGTCTRQYGFTNSGESKVVVSSEEVTWLKKIFRKVTNIFDAIIELPSKIINALKDFLLPDEQFIANYKNNFDSLLSEHFGALYQSIDAFKSLDDAFTSDVTTQDSIQMPEVTVSLAGSNYTFGGYSVKLIPDKIVPIVNILKTLLGIVATLLFINMLKHRYEGVVSK